MPPCIPPFLPLHPSFSSLHPSFFFLSPNSLLTLLISVCPPPSPPQPQPSSFIHPETLVLTLGREIPLHVPFFSNQSPDFYLSLHHLFPISFFSPSLLCPNPRHPEPWASSACYSGCRARCQHMGDGARWVPNVFKFSLVQL